MSNQKQALKRKLWQQVLTDAGFSSKQAERIIDIMSEAILTTNDRYTSLESKIDRLDENMKVLNERHYVSKGRYSVFTYSAAGIGLILSLLKLWDWISPLL